MRKATRRDTTGGRTNFLPFNRGNNGAAGNPANPDGHKTSYLWEQVWQRDSWLEILGRYLIAEKDEKESIKAVVFPRYHQLDVTRDLLATVLKEGPGRKYLIQHSAGSGKTKSIADGDVKTTSAAKDRMNALLLFRSDVATYLRVYTFLSQIFDYGNTEFEKRAIFFKYLVRLLKFGRERDGVDLCCLS